MLPYRSLIALLTLLASEILAQTPVFDATFTDVSVKAAQLALDVTNGVTSSTDFDSYSYESRNRASLTVATSGNYCYLALDGDFGSGNPLFAIWERFTALFFSHYETVCKDDLTTCCSVRNQWVDDYDSIRFLVNTAAQTTCGTKEIVVTGHGYGAGLAAIAAVELDNMDPWYISFSQPKLVQQGCAVDTSKWVRFLNTREDLRLHIIWLSYDNNLGTYPLGLFQSGMKYYGHLFVLTEGAETMAYLGLDEEGPTSPPDWTDYSSSMTTVGVDTGYTPGFDPPPEVIGGYLDRLLAYQTTATTAASFPISTGGFLDIELCNWDEECVSGNCDQRSFDGPFRCLA